MKKIVVVLAILALALVAAARAATVSGGSPTVSLVSSSVQADGSAQFQLKYANGQTIATRTLYYDGVQITDDRGAVLASPAPPALVSAVSSFVAQMNTLVANGAAAGKLNL